MRKRRVKRVPFSTSGPSMARQSAKDECDVNLIMRRFEKTGIIDHFNEHRGDYGDFTGAPSDYQEALNQVIAAELMFGSLPARVRKRFQNDPGEFLAFVEDPANVDELVELGLARKRPDQAVVQPEAGGAGPEAPEGPQEA